ncbi:MAG TPA: TolC family protein [bacterium]|nr:TolC family protein [bacterium]HPP02832.1 TolC family protein [bacterium]
MNARYGLILFLSLFFWIAAMPESQAAENGYTLQECLQTALKLNPDIAMAEQNAAAADAQKDYAHGEQWPALILRSTYTHSLDTQRLTTIRQPNEPSVFSEDNWKGDIFLTLPLFTGGRIIHSIQAAELLQLASEKRLARTRQELIYNVSRVFYDILAQQNVIESLQFSQRVLEEHEQRIQQLIQAERAAKVDLLRTQVQLANVIQNRIQESNILDIQRQVLMNLMGIENATEPLEIEGELNEEPFPAGRVSPPDRAYENRTDLQADQAEYQAQTNRVAAAAAEQWPALSLFGSYGGVWGIDPDFKQPGAASLEDTGMIGFAVEVPLFVGGRIQAKVREEQAKQLALQERVRKRRLQIQLEIETSIKTVQSIYQRVIAVKTAIAQAKESFRIEQEKYNAGKGTITDVLDAQSAMLTAETNYYQALAEYNIAIAQYDFAMGESQ